MEITKARQWLRRLAKWEYIWLCLLVVVTLAAHFSLISQPNEPIFDEQHYVPDARSILSGNSTFRGEHPPLGKLFIVSGILIFGDNPWGWRFFSIIFGTGSIILFYLICRQLGLSKRTSSLAIFLLALENMSFVQASVAMLDVYSLGFMLASFWLYLRGKYPVVGVFVALSALAKLYGAFALGVIILHWLLTRRDQRLIFTLSMLLAPVSFILLMIPFDFIIYRHFVNPISRVYEMVIGSSSLTFATVKHPSKSRPWAWLLAPNPIGYWYNPNYIGVINYNVWAFIVPTVGYMVFKAIKHHDSAGIFGVSWFISTYLVWIPLSLLTNRVTYVFYFYPTIGAICLGLGMGLSQLIDVWKKARTRKVRWPAISSVGVYLLVHTLVFAFLSPLSYWWGIPPIIKAIATLSIWR